MTAVAEIKYVALKPLSVDFGEGPERLKPGDAIPHPETWGRSLHANIEAGKIAALPVPDAAQLTDDELLAELKRRGLKPARPGRASTSA